MSRKSRKNIKEIKKKEEVQTKAGSVADRIMTRLQTSEAWMTRADLNGDLLVGGSIAAISKTLQRLEGRGVVEVKEEKNPDGGKPVKAYRILLAHGETKTTGQPPQTTSNEATFTTGHLPQEKPIEEECPVVDSSPGASSADVEDVSACSRARTEEEVNAAIAQSQWDDPVVEVTSVDKMEAIKAMADHDNCIDVEVTVQNKIVSKGLEGVIDV